MKFTKRRSQDVHKHVCYAAISRLKYPRYSVKHQSINHLNNILNIYKATAEQKKQAKQNRIVLALTFNLTKGKFGLSPSSFDALDSFLTMNFHLVKKKVLNLCRLKHDCNDGLQLYQNKKFIHPNHPILNRIGIKNTLSVSHIYTYIYIDFICVIWIEISS